MVSVVICKADQLAYITKEQAQKATDFLKSQKKVVLWCACCDKDSPKRVIKVSKVYFLATGYEDTYKVVLEGKDSDGKHVKEELDLAYVHCKQKGMAECVGKALGFDCDPCTDAFKWPE